MVVSLQFFLLLLLFYFSGRGLFILFSKANFIDEDISNLKIFTIPINYFYITSTSNATSGDVSCGGDNCSAGPVTLGVVNA